MSLNFVLLEGNLGHPPAFSETDGGVDRLEVRIATDRSYTTTDGKEVKNTDWTNCVMWGKRTRQYRNLLRKGDRISIRGQLRSNSWKDDSGEVKYSTFVQVDEMSIFPVGESSFKKTSVTSEPEVSSSVESEVQ